MSRSAINTPPSGRFFIYCRKSTENEERQVQSIESQRLELARIFGDAGITIVAVFEESQSAKSPGRPLFAEMLRRVEAGEADGILSWAPDRLARNSVDGGQIIHLLDTGTLKDLKFATYTFENNSNGKFMLQVMFGQSKYYSDALSDVVKRGNRAKVKKGWRPGVAPLGYRNDLATRTIVPDPERAPIIRRIFDLALTGGYSIRDMARIARDEWGLRTPGIRRLGDVPVPPNSIHHLLTNPFYAGQFIWEGVIHEGQHKALVTVAEFELVQRRLQARRPRSARPKRYTFPLTGIIRCGACGRGVTSEYKTNGSGRRYHYYHCTWGKGAERCRQPSLQAADLERQALDLLIDQMQDPHIEQKLRLLYTATVGKARYAVADVRESLARRAAQLKSEMSSLTDMRLRKLIDDEEFEDHHRRMLSEDAAIKDELVRTHQLSMLAADNDNGTFGAFVLTWFEDARDEVKRLIMQTACPNLTLSEKVISCANG